MKLASLELIARRLNEAGARYLVVGGVAVNIHGYTRATRDVDLVVGLSRDNVGAAVEALRSLGYQPMVPVAFEAFVEADNRKEWVEHRHMQVFSVVSDSHPETTVDIFVTEPFDFDAEYKAAEVYEIASGVEIRVPRLDVLIAMKREAGRPRDLDDIQHLQWVLDEKRRRDGE